MTQRLLAGVDVGSRSVRAGLFDSAGTLLGHASRPISVAVPAADESEQSTDEIWSAVAASVREAVRQSGRDPSAVAAVGFDATSSVALFHADGSPASVSRSGDDRWNVVMWSDHRAVAEAAEIDRTGHRVLRHVGGRMSPEMVLPKLLWLKRHRPDMWPRYGLALDLADFLVWRATGVVHGGQCTFTCKWGYLPHEAEPWPADFLAAIGLADLHARLGVARRASPVGSTVGTLTPAAAAELGLPPGCRVPVGQIDAHAGCLAPLGALSADGLDEDLAVIGGTSTCLMALSREPRFVDGVWGPYFETLRPATWLVEGGQSATGAALDQVVALHAAGAGLGADPHATLAAEIWRRMQAGSLDEARYLVVPDFNGNRSPLADPLAGAVVAGLDLETGPESLVHLYHATCVGLALGTRHVIEALNAGGWRFRRIHLSGGHARNPALVQLYADATGCDVHPAGADDGVVLGGAISAAVAGEVHPDLPSAAAAMARTPAPVVPQPRRRAALDRDFDAFRALQAAAARRHAPLPSRHAMTR